MSLLKKTFLITALSTSFAFADDAALDLKGLYAGIQGGINFLNLSVTQSFPHSKKTSRKTATFAGIHLGYQYTFNNHYLLGFELFADMGRINVASDLQGNDHLPQHIFEEYHDNVAWGGMAKIGYQFERWLPYAKLGFDLSQIRYEYGKKYVYKHYPERRDGRGNKIADARNEYSYYIDKHNKTHLGFTIGVGLSYDVDQNFTVGGEFKHVIYNAKTYNITINGQQLARKVKPQTSSILFNLLWRF